MMVRRSQLLDYTFAFKELIKCLIVIFHTIVCYKYVLSLSLSFSHGPHGLCLA